jgi:hypothetical protein
MIPRLRDHLAPRSFTASITAPALLPPSQSPAAPVPLAKRLVVLNRTRVVFQDQISAVGERVGFFADSRESSGLNAWRLERATRPGVAGLAIGGCEEHAWPERALLTRVPKLPAG